MRHRFLTLLVVMAATPATAATFAPSEAADHVGQRVTMEGVANVYTPRTAKVTFVDLGGTGRSAPFSGAIFETEASKFPSVASYSGKKVNISGTVQLYQGKPEIILKAADQLKIVD